MTVRMVQYKWGGRFLWFEITSQCSECDLTTKILENMMDKEFEGKDVSFEVKPWLDSILYCLVRGAWHAPIIMVEGKKFYQFSEKQPLFDRKRLAAVVDRALQG